ncbi:MAG: DUF2059 domain-containing protein [Chromatiales bacterium]|jgi:hypothetical protein
MNGRPSPRAAISTRLGGGFALLLLTALTAGPTLAHAGSHRQAVERLFELTRMQQKIEASVRNVLALQLQQSPALREHEQALRDFLERHVGWGAMKDELAGMYMEAFTEQELRQINAFYSTPTGQKLIGTLPELIKQRDRLAMERNIGELRKAIAEQAEPAP